MTVQCAGTPNDHLYRVTYIRCIDTINSPDDGHMAVQNMQRIEINIHEKNCASGWLLTKIITRNYSNNEGVPKVSTVNRHANNQKYIPILITDILSVLANLMAKSSGRISPSA
jgi:hypothetical protein